MSHRGHACLDQWPVVNPNVTSLLTLIIIGLPICRLNRHQQRDPSHLYIILCNRPATHHSTTAPVGSEKHTASSEYIFDSVLPLRYCLLKTNSPKMSPNFGSVVYFWMFTNALELGKQSGWPICTQVHSLLVTGLGLLFIDQFKRTRISLIPGNCTERHCVRCRIQFVASTPTAETGVGSVITFEDWRKLL